MSNMAVYTVRDSRFYLPNFAEYTSALKFTGTTDNATITAVGASLKTLTTLTVAMWVRGDSSATNGRLLSKKSGSTGYWAIAFDGGSFKFFAGYTGVGQWRTLVGGRVTGSWQHLVVKYTFGTLSNDPIFYIDGVKQTSLSQDIAPTGTATTDDDNLYFGNRSGLNAPALGDMQNVQIYNRILTDDECYQIYRKGLPISSGLVGYWKMNEGTGSTLVDSTGISANATITGATWNSDVPFTQRSVAPVRNSGRADGTMSFDGVSQYMQYPILPSVDGFCFAMWIYVPVLQETFNRHFLSWQDGELVRGMRFSIINSTQQFQLTTYNNTVSVGEVRAAYPSIGWYHVAGTMLPNSLKIYVNGFLIQTDTTATMIAANANFLIGKRSFQSSWANFKMYGFVFQNTVTPWTAKEVQDLYTYGQKPSGSSYYRFNNNFNDNSGNGNTLINYGATIVSDPPVNVRTLA